MCRLFGMIAAEPQTGEAWLVRSDRSLLAQSNASPETAQRDGWGIGWFEPNDRVRIEKGTAGAFEAAERPLFERAAADANGTVVIGHLRRASNPLQLPHDRLVGIENSQPFGTHTTLFAHNGMISFPNETRPYLGVHAPEVKGVNDSEVLFRLLLRHYEEVGDPFRAYVHAVDDLGRVWAEVGRPSVEPYSGLNVLFSNGPSDLWMFALSRGEHGPGLLDRSRPYYQMAYLAEPHRLIVGSEPFDGTPGLWKPLPSGHYLHARRRDRRIEVEGGEIPVPALAPAARPGGA
jgi:predicted glutamine amidotransferase